jgi:hypothetical protein
MARPKGSMNKTMQQNLLVSLRERFGEAYHPVEQMAELAEKLVQLAVDPTKEPDQFAIKSAIDALDKVAAYTAPKLKAMEVDVTSSDGSLSQVRAIQLVPVAVKPIEREVNAKQLRG